MVRQTENANLSRSAHYVDFFWISSKTSGCRSFPGFKSLRWLLEVCLTVVREDHCFKLLRLQSIDWSIIPALSFAVFSSICPNLRLQDLFDTIEFLSFFSENQMKNCWCHFENSMINIYQCWVRFLLREEN